MLKEQYIWDFRDPYQWMEKVAKNQMPPIMIFCAITGAAQGKEANPHLPETIEEQVEAVYEAYQEGAVSVHIHARNPQNTGESSFDKNIFSRINEMVRKRCPDIIINNSTGGPPDHSHEQKMASLHADVKPDMASLNPGPFMADIRLKARGDELPFPRPEKRMDICIPMKYSDVRLYAKTMKENGIKPEVELFQPGHYWVVMDLIEKGLIDPPYVIQFVMGFPTSIYPTPWNVLNMMNELPKDSVFIVPGIGVYQLPMNMIAIIMGGHVRVGLEDNVYYRKGELAESSAQQVARIKRIAKEMNREIATIAQAREMLGLKKSVIR